MMRKLTDSEQEALRQARIVWLSQLTVVNKSMSESHKAGYIAGLDYSAAQLAALTAENATLSMEIEAANIAAGEWEETAAALTTERDTLREALKQIAAGNPAPPGGKWLSDSKMAQIARQALGETK